MRGDKGSFPVKPKLQRFQPQGRLARLDIGCIAGKAAHALIDRSKNRRVLCRSSDLLSTRRLLPAAEEPRRHKPSSDSQE